MGVRPLRWLRENGSGLRTGVTVTRADLFHPMAIFGAHLTLSPWTMRALLLLFMCWKKGDVSLVTTAENNSRNNNELIECKRWLAFVLSRRMIDKPERQQLDILLALRHV